MAQMEAWARRASVRIRAEFARRWADAVAAIRLRPVQVGLLGTTLLALGSLTPAYLPQASPFWPTMRALGLDTWPAKAGGTALVITSVALLIGAWFSLRPTVYHDVKHWAVLAWWSLPLLFAPPIFSHDAYAYAAYGWLLHNGLNPYEVVPGGLPGTFADQVDWLWRYTPAPYGPLALQIGHGLVDVAGFNPYYSAVLMRLPALVGVALIMHYLPRLGHQMGVPPADVAWFSAINPLLVIDFVGGAHNDALMMGLVVLALYLGNQGRFLIALVLVGVAGTIKQPALLAAYPIAVFGSNWASWHPRELLRFGLRATFAVGVAVVVFVGVSLATGLGFGWVDAMGVPGMIVTLAPFSILGWLVQSGVDWVGLDPSGHAARDAAQVLGLILAVVIIGYQLVKRSRTEPMRFLAWSFLALAVFGPALNTWYLLWGGLLLPLARPSQRVWQVAAMVTTVLLVFGAANLAWRNDAVALALAALAAVAIYLYRRPHLAVPHLPEIGSKETST